MLPELCIVQYLIRRAVAFISPFLRAFQNVVISFSFVLDLR